MGEVVDAVAVLCGSAAPVNAAAVAKAINTGVPESTEGLDKSFSKELQSSGTPELRNSCSMPLLLEGQNHSTGVPEGTERFDQTLRALRNSC